MLNIIKERVGDTLSIRLTGSLVGECVNLETLIGATPKTLRVNCKSLVRLNSNGVRAWIRYFDNVRARGTQVILTECSPAIVDRINSFKNFACGSQIESIYVPYCCTGCKRELLGLFSIEELKRSGSKMPDLNCPSCSKVAEFDDLPKEYFRFMERDFKVTTRIRGAKAAAWGDTTHTALASHVREPSMMIQRPTAEAATGFIRRVGSG